LSLSDPESNDGTTVTMLGYDGLLKWSPGTPGMDIYMPLFTPSNIPCQWAWVFKIDNVN